MDDDTATEVSRAELAGWTRAVVATLAPASETPRIVEVLLPAAEEAYESALVQGLCRDGAREVLDTTVAEETRRLLGLVPLPRQD